MNRRILPICTALAAIALAGCTPEAKVEAPKEQAPVAAAQDEGGHDGPLVPTIGCDAGAMFNASTTKASLIEAHGAGNVKEAKAPWVDSEVDSLVLFPDNPAMSAELLWLEAVDAKPWAARVSGGPESLWVGPEGILLGATVADIEAVNGGPFMITAFENHNHGEVSNFLGGKLDSAAGAKCRLSLSTNAGPSSPQEAVAKLSGDSEKTFRSDSPEVRAANIVVDQIVISHFQ